MQTATEVLTSIDPIAARQQFGEQGYIILKGVLEPDVVQQAREAMTVLVNEAAQKLIAQKLISDPLENESFETRLASLYETCPSEAPKSFRQELHLAGLFPIFFNPAVLDLAELFLGPEIRLYPNYTARPKLPDNEATVVLWHQDGGYTEHAYAEADDKGGPVSSLRMVNVWSPLVPARVENGCMQFVPGTHKLGVVPHEGREHYLEIAPEILAQHQDRAINIELDPGDVVLFHNLLFHRGLPNQSKTIRWSLDWRYQDATQPTLRPQHGHIARSHAHPEQVVQNAADWSERSFV